MIRLSKLSDYAIVALCELARGPMGNAASACVLAQRTGVPEPTVAKLLKHLAVADLVASTRGAHGGYRLARPLGELSVADVIAAIDGAIALTACVDGGSGQCDVQSVCSVRGRWNLVNEAIRSALEGISLAELRQASPSRRVATVDILMNPVE